MYIIILFIGLLYTFHKLFCSEAGPCRPILINLGFRLIFKKTKKLNFYMKVHDILNLSDY